MRSQAAAAGGDKRADTTNHQKNTRPRIFPPPSLPTRSLTLKGALLPKVFMGISPFSSSRVTFWRVICGGGGEGAVLKFAPTVGGVRRTRTRDLPPPPPRPPPAATPGVHCGLECVRAAGSGRPRDGGKAPATGAVPSPPLAWLCDHEPLCPCRPRLSPPHTSLQPPHCAPASQPARARRRCGGASRRPVYEGGGKGGKARG